jgi:cytochrome o ubiquinol oxidase operon protein cyoD
MSTHESTKAQPSVSAYVLGFVLSLVLTFGSYIAVTHHLFSRHVLLGTIVSLAVIQLVVQLVCFLHLGQEDKPKWRSISFLFMLLVIGIVVIGSLWIMHSLQYNMMPKQGVETYILDEESIHR